ncbi:hypothetical protein CEG14_00150 [Bordetella genomosp. 1]|nr:DUF3806 domain-containing protein [Bordetella genomosp. 1]MDQ8032786.1 DUF3806 domain-containing protein [Bordetella sp.]OZI40217.1 hypothetical protein CEG14_00150 [Bordetella genomosp. 1]
MDPKIEALSPAEQQLLDDQFAHADELVQSHTRKPLDGSHEDLVALQRLLDTKTIEPEAQYTLESLGVAFGRVFTKQFPAYHWCMVEDEFGRDPAVQYKQTSLLVFPSQMLLKRVEERTPFTVPGLYEEMRIQLDDIRNEHFPGE